MRDKCLACGTEAEIAREAAGTFTCWECSRKQRETARKLADENRRLNASRRTGCALYPKVCDFVGVHPNQIPEASKFLSARGVEPSFTPEGDFAPQSKQHYRAYQKAMGLKELDRRHGK